MTDVEKIAIEMVLAGAAESIAQAKSFYKQLQDIVELMKEFKKNPGDIPLCAF